jgi:ParB-like chromosome segregation protein Spo0J
VPRHSPTRVIDIARIKIGPRHRKDMGDLKSLADNIAKEGLLQPIGITENDELVFGERRLKACRDILGWTEIEARVVGVSSIVAGEHAENELRKEFTPSERVAIVAAIEVELRRRERRGRPAKEKPDGHPEFRAGAETREIAAKRAGFGSSYTARAAEAVVTKGVPELVEAMDKGDVAISAAADIAKLPASDQRQAITAARPLVRSPRPNPPRPVAGARAKPDSAAAISSMPASVPPAARRRESDPFAGAKGAQARDAKNVGDLEGALALFTELIEPVYLGAEDFVRQRIEGEIRRILASLREKAIQPRRELATDAPAGRA